MSDGGPAFPCKWCSRVSVRKQGRIWLCAQHYRLQQMRVNAKRHKKEVPSYEVLEHLAHWLGNPPICPICHRFMNWLAVDGAASVVTLQHDRSGDIRLMCLACNTKHAAMPNDTFYSLPSGHRRCPRCEQTKPFAAFSLDRSRVFPHRKTYCKECASVYHKEWRIKCRAAVS